MKFDTLVESILLEMPHISFDSRGKVLNINLEMEKFQKDYGAFVNHVKNIIMKMTDDQVKNDFFEELKQNKQLSLYLNKLYQKELDQFLLDVSN
jgi:hypothetical protein